MHGKKQQQYSDAPEITEAKPKRGIISGIIFFIPIFESF